MQKSEEKYELDKSKLQKINAEDKEREMQKNDGYQKHVIQAALNEEREKQQRQIMEKKKNSMPSADFSMLYRRRHNNNNEEENKSEDFKIRASDFVAQHEGKLKDHYRIGKILGAGSFGEVRSCVHRINGAQRAVKILRKSSMDDQEKLMLFNEMNNLRDLDHPNVLKLYEFYEDPKRYYIVTEICKGGELFDEIVARKQFSEMAAAKLMKQILSCINYCHSNHIMHRDLKPENILLEKNKDYDQIKIIDFGTSVFFDENVMIKEKLGTPYYIAPEVLQKKYTSKCDIWSCGVIAYIVLCGVPPFNGESEKEILKKVKKGQIMFNGPVWANISGEAKDFILKLLTLDQKRRPSAQEALKHPWIVEAYRKTDKKIDKKQAECALTNMRTFNSSSKIQQATYAFIASQLISKQEKEEIDKLFRAMDVNGDGKLSKEEVQSGYMEYYGKELSQKDVDEMFIKVDADGSGEIDYSEFVIASMSEKDILNNKKLEAAFKMFDKDGGGTISIDEIKQVLSLGQNVDQQTIEEVLSQVDANGDGEISFEEFVSMMRGSVGQS